MKFEIKNRWNNEILFSIEADNRKLAVEAAIKSKANLSEADLSEADLSEANLSEANLSWSDLSWADLIWANLSKANLSKANLSEADLRYIKHDILGILLHAIPEVPVLRQAIIDGNIDGSVYEGDCACLCGTIANARKCSYKDLPGIVPDGNSMAEQFFKGIKKGDTPENNNISKIVLGWIDEFLLLIK